MEKSRKTKKIVLVVLLLIVIGLSIGFAAFTSQLTIKSNASVTGDSTTFKVVFSSSQSSVESGTVVTGGKAEGGAISGTTLSGLEATFTAPGQTATWEVYAYNAGQFDAFLKNVTVGSITGTAGVGTTQSYVDEAIKGISIKVNVRNEDYPTTTSITSHKLEKATAEKVVVTLSYAAGSATADGDFTVNIGDILLDYNSVD